MLIRGHTDRMVMHVDSIRVWEFMLTSGWAKHRQTENEFLACANREDLKNGGSPVLHVMSVCIWSLAIW